MKKVIILTRALRGASVLLLLVCGFSFGQVMGGQPQPSLKLKLSADDLEAQKAGVVAEEQAQRQKDLDVARKAEMQDVLQRQQIAEKTVQRQQQELKKAEEDKRKLQEEVAAERKKLQAEAEADRKKLQEELAAAKKTAEDVEALRQEKVVLEQKVVEATKKLEESKAYQDLPPKEKAIKLAQELGKAGLEDKRVIDALKKSALWDVLPDEKKKQLDKGGFFGQGGIFGTGAHQKETAIGGGVGVGGLAGVGGLGLGLTEMIKPGTLGGGSSDAGAAGGAAGEAGAGAGVGAGEAAGSGQIVVSGMQLDLSKLTMPALQPLQPDLKQVMYASKSIVRLTDQLLKATTIPMVIKVQDSFNLTFAAMKNTKTAEFNADAAVEQINAKILQDCKDLKSFVATFLDVVGETKRKPVTLDGIRKMLGQVITQVKDNFKTLFTLDIVAQLTAMQQRVAKVDLLDFMKRVNKTVQAALDAAGQDVDKTIKKRMTTAGIETKSTTEEMSSSTEPKTSADTTTTESSSTKEESTAAGWDALVNQ